MLYTKDKSGKVRYWKGEVLVENGNVFITSSLGIKKYH
jgi:hypothetical protein